jgi:hypothetical protein
MPDFKSSIKNMFKDERYWEGIAVGAVTTLLGEWVATTASSALVTWESYSLEGSPTRSRAS